MAKRSSQDDDLPAELEYLRVPALRMVGGDRQIVGCGQLDFDGLEPAIRDEVAGLSSKQAAAKKLEQGKALREWLAKHEASDEPLAVGLRFVELLLSERWAPLRLPSLLGRIPHSPH